MKNLVKKFTINKNKIGEGMPTYFIADIAANHDGNLKRAKKLIKLCAEAGANAAKFQHFEAKTIVSKEGFENLKSKLSHQKTWKKSVFDVYQDASINLKWTQELRDECKKNKIDFFTSPYSLKLVDFVNKYIPAYKIGSGDITWKEILIHIAKKNKPVILATGASNQKNVENAIKWILNHNNKLAVLQCNTNYTASKENYNYINLKYLTTLKNKYKNLIIGLSDHTEGHTTVLGAISLGAKIIEKHFTDNNDRIGPDHKFSMNPTSWSSMIKESRNLEASLGNGIKKIENNEKSTVYIQRRSIRTNKLIKKGKKININKDLICLRPFKKNSIEPYDINKINGFKAKKDINKGDAITWKMLVKI